MIDTGLACFAIMANFFEKPISIDQIKHKYDRQNSHFEEYELLQLAKEFSFKARFVETKWERLDKAALPAIAQSKDGAYFILGRVADDKALIQDPAKGNHPEVLNKEEFTDRWNGRLLMMTCREFINGKNRKFDISWFIPAVVKYRRLFGEVILASFFLQLFALVSPLLFQVVIDKVLVNRGLSSLDVLMVALICIGIFETLLGGLRTYTFSHTTTRVDVELGASLFKHLIRLPLSYFGVRRVGDTVARVHELENIRNFLTGSTLTLIIDFFFTIIFFTVMFFYSKTLTLLVLLSIPFYVLLSLFFTPILRSRIDERFRRGAENQCFLVEAVSGVETVKSLAVEPQMQRRWEQQLAAYVGSSFRASHINNIAGQLVQLVQKITMALTLWIGASLVMKGELSVGQLIAFNMLSGRVTQPILRLAQLWQNFQQAKISIEKLSDILNNPAENTETLSKGSMPEIKGDVEFKDITFRYVPNGPEILKKMNFKVRAGQKIGFVGPSGSGKSTVTKLIQRLYIPESGKVLIDGIDISTVDTAWLRRQIGVVLQENYLFNKSVRENIALTNPAISMDRIIAAARLAGAHDFITELPHGYDTIIEERGSSLSGGQRQRIAIARALVNNPRILIFDEATSALDYESERIIQQNMASICKGRTVFMIAHRLSTVRDCDRIITIEKGEITETGTHQELLKRGGRYAYLWNSQTALIVPANEEEFLPAVLEVTEMPPSYAARLLTYVIILMFTTLILWSILGKIDIIATSAGKLMPASNIKTIQTLTDSEIEEIYVQEGQYVKEGQDLIKFNQTEVLANINRVENEMEALEISVARLQALLTDNPEENFTYNKEIDEYLIKMHTDLLKSQLTEKAAEIEVLNGQITKAEKEKDTIQADLTRIEKLLPSVEERIEKKRILVDKKLLARLTFLEQEEELINLQEQRNVQAKKMAETEANIESLKKEQWQYLAEFDKNIMQELTESREKLASYQQELIKYQEALKRTVVKAPLSGYVQQLVYHTKGGVVETAKPIMNLVPEDYKLEAEVQILNKDIGFVRPEQDVEIKIDSFPFTKYGTIKGKVRNISGDAIQDEKLGLVFNARLTLLDNKIKADGQIIQLKPGMSVTAEIKTGKRRVIEYLLSPVMKYLDESMRER